MKKLKLQAQQLGATEFLTREQLKNVVGGSGGEPCFDNFSCSSGYYCSATDGSGYCVQNGSGGCSCPMFWHCNGAFICVPD